MIRLTETRHCEPQGVERRPSFRTGYGEAIQRNVGALPPLDCFVAALLAMTRAIQPNVIIL